MDALGFVEPGFTDAVISREKQYPTGLPTKIPVALCHVEAEFVKETALAVATLESPVSFNNMGDPKSELQVKLVFLLTIVDPKKQVQYLRKMMGLFKDETLSYLEKAQSKKDVISLLKNLLLIN
jgi:PTS system galactitol-specific IIA component